LTEMGVRVKKTLPIPAFELSLFEHVLPWICWVFEKGDCDETGMLPTLLVSPKNSFFAKLLIQQG